MENKEITIKWGDKEYSCVLEYKPPRMDERPMWRQFNGEIKEIPIEIACVEENEEYEGYFARLNNPDRSHGGYSAFIDLDYLFGAGDYYRIGLAGEGGAQSSPQKAVDKVREELDHAISELIAIRGE